MSRASELSADPAQAAIAVIVGIVTDGQGKVLIARRPKGKPQAGAWEFPGGKLQRDELPLAGLKRELEEELGIAVGEAEPFVEQRYRYPDRRVHLDVWWVLDYTGDPTGREEQVLRWVDAAELAEAPMLPADEPIVTAVRERL